MKKTISRMLALLLTLVILMSGMSTALASATQELGSIEDVEKLLFEAVLDVFPSSTLEQQYIYAQYYEENGNAAAVENLLASLNSEQLIAFTNFKAEHGCTCYDEAENLICEGVEVCECLCHKVAAFVANMDALIVSVTELEEEGIDAARAYIIRLRFKEIILAMMQDGEIANEPNEYIGYEPPYYDDYLEMMNAVMSLSLEDAEEEQIMVTEEALNKLTELELEAQKEGIDIDTSTAQAVRSVVEDNNAAEMQFVQTYGASADYSVSLSDLDDETNETLTEMVRLLSGDPLLLANELEGTPFVDIGKIQVTSNDQNIKYSIYDFQLSDSVDVLPFYADDSELDSILIDGDVSKIPDYDENWSSSANVNPYVKHLLKEGFPNVSKSFNGSYQSLSSLFTSSNLIDTVYGAGLLKNTNGEYTYDAQKNAAYYDESSNKFTLYDGIVLPYAYRYQTDKGTGNNYCSSSIIGNFFPFNELPGNVGQVYDIGYGYNENGEWIDDETPKRYYLDADKQKTNMWFGMVIEFDFYMPQGGSFNDKEMVFSFAGDDDVWVFIDDALILDIGGLHTARQGNINFRTGEVSFQSPHGNGYTTTTIKDMVDAAYEEGNKVDSRHDTSNWTSNTYPNYSKHTLKFFYLERGAGRSTCKLKFNMPTLPPGGLWVSKEYSDNSLTTGATDMAEYSFMIADSSNYPIANRTYTLVEDDDEDEGSHSTDNNGIFKLRANQQAHFEELDVSSYTITELGHDYTGGIQWKIVDNYNLGGKTGSDDSVNVYVAPAEDSGAVVTFTNTLKTTFLTVDKKVVNPRPVDADNVYTFEASICYGLEGTTPLETVRYLQGEGDTEPTTLNADSNGKFTFTMKADDEPITFIDLPIGATVTITEVNTPAKGEVKAVNVADFALTAVSTNFAEEVGMGSDGAAYTFTGVMSGVEGSTVTFTNTPQIYDLTITKAGLDMDIDPYSSTMYSVVCEDNNIDMTVAIYGNNSVTINDLPVGTYTVTELTDWSWRYTSSSNREYNQVTLSGTDDSITFTNERVYDKWLDSDCYAENTFDGTPSDDRRPKQ